MSRVAKQPIPVPKGVDVKIESKTISVKGPKGQAQYQIPEGVLIKQEADGLQIVIDALDRRVKRFGEEVVNALSGTVRALINNVVQGAHHGFEKKLLLVGVGYRAQAQGNKLNLTLGLSHPAIYPLPAGVTAEVPSQTEITLKSMNKQLLGQVAAEIRSMRPPEPYKGKGIRYADERIIQKETKKK